MKHLVALSFLSFAVLAGCSQKAAEEEVIDYVPQVKVMCDTIETCERDKLSEDVALAMHASTWLTKNELMTQATNRGLHTKNAAFESQLIYWRNRTLHCDDVNAVKGQCTDLNSPDVPPRIREILLGEKRGQMRDYVKEHQE